MLGYRLIFGSLMIIALLAVALLGDQVQPSALPPGLVMSTVIWLLAAMTALELCCIFRAKAINADPVIVTLSAIAGCALFYFGSSADISRALAAAATVAAGLMLAALIRHSYRGQPHGAAAAAAATMFAFVYLGLMPGFLIAIGQSHGTWFVAAIVLITKSCDIGAYFTGRAIGCHKLIAWLSPGKTWEGLVGGMVLSVVVALAMTIWANHANYHWPGAQDEQSMPLWFAAFAAAVLALLGQFGDLVASLLKRDAGVKDSGGAVPGFGGLLDIVDSLIVVAPAAYWLLLIAPLSG